MKKNSIYALMSAIVLSGGVMFSGCSSSDDVVTNEYGEEINPTYDPVAKTVKTDFTIALTGQVNDSKAETRMLGPDVQATGFKGIKDIVLLPYSGTPADNNSAGSAIALGDNTINDQQLNAKAESHHYHYIGVEVPTGTKNFLFYGVSNPANATTVAGRFKYGVLNPTLAGKVKPSEIKFDLVPIYPTVEATNAKRDALVNYLKEIAAATDGETAWKDVSAATDAELNALYISFTSLKSGSSASIRKHVQNTYSLVYNRTSDVNIGTVAQAIVDAICGEDNKYATEGMTTGDDPVKNGILTFNDTNVPTDYPESINLPDGAAVIQWTDGVPSVLSNEEDIIKANNNPMTNYVYPPSLYYYTNSTIRVANTVQDNNYAIKDADKWNEILSGYGSANGTVTEATRDIALENEIQYAVGRMELTVKPGATTLKDRNGTDIAIEDGSFEVTGVFIGSQHSKIYNFADNNGGTEYLIYDKLASAVSVPASSASSKNHTLAMQTTADASVAIAVELVNNTGVDFVGFDGIVPNGSKFYLSTSLVPNTGTNYNSSTVNSVFIQDYVTKVALTISANTDGSGDPAVYPKGLGDARVTIPNLGTPALRLGFSVDLSWSTGLVFEPEI